MPSKGGLLRSALSFFCESIHFVFNSLISFSLTSSCSRNLLSASRDFSKEFLKKEFEYVAHKLDLTTEELQKIFDGKNKTYKDYKNKMGVIKFGAQVMQKLGLEKRLFR